MNKWIPLAVIGVGGVFLLSRQNTAANAINDDGSITIDPVTGLPISTNQLTPAQRAALAQYAGQAGPGNAPIAPAPGFFSGPAGIGAIDTGILGGVGIAASAGVFGGALATGAATLGIGFAVAFFSYEFLKQRASMHTNDVRDAWQRQFIDLHRALGIRDLTAEQVRGSGPGNIEMAEVIFYFDHDDQQRRWKAVTQTQNEQQFRAAARDVENFLRSQGVPVTDIG